MGYRSTYGTFHNRVMQTTVAPSLWQRIASEGVRKVVESVSDAESLILAERFGTHNYHPLPVNVVKGTGAYVWDGSGKEYIDCIGAYSAVAHGHLSDYVVKAATEQLDKLALVSRAMYCSELGVMLQALCEYSESDMACPMNTGVEAIETCIKLARKWAYTVKGIPQDKAEIVACEGNFHGRTTTIVGFSSEEAYKENFGPFTPGFQLVPFGDIAALEKAITPNTAAFLAEPIQAEGGVIIPPAGYMAAVRRLCDTHNVLLIWDEVQTGFCRTGKRFGWQHEDARPDLMAVGKPLGGGLYPVSAALGKREVMEVFVPGDHGSTFGGNPLASVIAIAALAEMEMSDFAGRSERLGDRLMRQLRALPFDSIKEIRGRGLLVGLEFDETVDTKALTSAFIGHGLLTKETRHRTFRFAPPLGIDDSIVDEIATRVEDAVRSVA